MSKNDNLEKIGTDYKYGFRTETSTYFDTGRGISEEVVRTISKCKNEPDWMLDLRVKAYHKFNEKNWPSFDQVWTC